MRNSIRYSLLIFGLIALLSACQDKNSPGVEFMPNMYRSPAVEPNSELAAIGDDNSSSLQPAENSIARGQSVYGYPNTNEGYAMAGANLKNPIVFSENVLKEGKDIYAKFCIHCHGKSGQGDGTVPTNSDYPPPPSYSNQLKDLPAGQIFHSITYGKNLMGSHSSQISKEDRWKLVYYVQSLQDKDRFDSENRGLIEEEQLEMNDETIVETKEEE